MGRIANGWELTKQSWDVLASDKKLLVFPLISTAACLLVMASFALPIAFNIDWKAVASSNSSQANVHLNNPSYYALLLFYFVSYFVVVFFNSALVVCVHEQFRGGTPTINSGLAGAASRLPQILMWALLSATVGFILQMIAERSKIVGAIIARLLGAAWTIATYFAIPVLVVEKAGPFEVFSRSVSLLRKSWGESLVSNVSLGLIVLAAWLIAAVPMALGIVMAVNTHGPGAPLAAIAGACVTVIAWIVIALVHSTLRVILTTALYEYAASGTPPASFDGEMLRQAFRTKN